MTGTRKGELNGAGMRDSVIDTHTALLHTFHLLLRELIERRKGKLDEGSKRHRVVDTPTALLHTFHLLLRELI